MAGRYEQARRGASLAALLLVCLCAGPARAHNQSQGHSRFTLHGTTLTARVWLVAADYHALTGLDRQDDGVISEEELAAGEGALSTFTTQMLRVFALDETGRTEKCVPQFNGLDLSGVTGLPLRYPFEVAFRCPFPPAALEVRFGLFVGSPVRHVNVGTFTFPDHEEEVVFSTEQREVTVRVAPPSTLEVAGRFLSLGVEHILTGYDHLVFLLALLMGARRFLSLLWAVTAFTLAHSVTLILAALNLLAAPSHLVEPAIALSIMLVAADDLRRLWRGVDRGPPRALLAFGFGLIHGLGFASALREAKLPAPRMVSALLAFNLGVEAGQVVFCALCFAGLVALRRTRAARGVSLALSAGCLICGGYWLVARVVG